MFSCHPRKSSWHLQTPFPIPYTQIHPELDQQVLYRCTLPPLFPPSSPEAPFPHNITNKSLLSVVHSSLGGLILKATAKDTGPLGFYFQFLLFRSLDATALQRMSSDIQFPLSVSPAIETTALCFWRMGWIHILLWCAPSFLVLLESQVALTLGFSR